MRAASLGIEGSRGDVYQRSGLSLMGMEMKRVPKPDIEDTSRVRVEASEEGIRRYCEARFGMSVHWGLYSLNTSSSEWAYFQVRIPFETYRKRMDRFDPVRFQAEEWADLMLEAGQKLLLITCLGEAVTGLAHSGVMLLALRRSVY